MAILDGNGDPILIVSMDLIEVTEQDIADSISIFKPLVSDAEIQRKKDIIDRLLTSDSWNKRIRIPILITDVLQVQMVGSNASNGKTVDYMVNGDVSINNMNNNVSVELSLKNSIGDLSVIGDILSAVFTRVFTRYTSSARASFFGHNVCIFNGYLTGVNRQTVGDSDKERMNLTFERANDNPETEEKEETATVPDKVDGKVSTPASEPPFEIPKDVDPALAGVGVGIQANANPNAGGAVGDRVFYWYNIGGLDDYLISDVPQVASVKNVNRLSFNTNVARSFDLNGVFRQAITIIYDGVNLPLGLNGHYPYFSPKIDSALGYAITTQNGWLYIGIETNAS